MDNKKRTLIVDTFDDLISMNGDVYDTQKLTVKYASCKFSAEYVRDILATLHNLEWFDIKENMIRPSVEGYSKPSLITTIA